MLKKLMMGGLAAGAIAVPLAGAAWAQPDEPTPPTVPGSNGPTPAAAPSSNGPTVPGSNGQGLTCKFQSGDPVQGPPGAMWREVALIFDPSVIQALDPGFEAPTPGQVVKLFCEPAGAAATAPGQQSAPGQQMPPGQLPAQGQQTALGQEMPPGQQPVR